MENAHFFKLPLNPAVLSVPSVQREEYRIGSGKCVTPGQAVLGIKQHRAVSPRKGIAYTRTRNKGDLSFRASSARKNEYIQKNHPCSAYAKGPAAGASRREHSL